ncbi:MAG: AIR synthase-related protein, partial [archaeon]
FKTFNMGWGFGLITEKKEVEGIIKLLKKEGINAEEIGEVNSRKESITIERKGKEIELNK